MQQSKTHKAPDRVYAKQGVFIVNNEEVFEFQNESGIDMHDCYHACHPLKQDTEPRVAVATACQTDSDLEKPF